MRTATLLAEALSREELSTEIPVANPGKLECSIDAKSHLTPVVQPFNGDQELGCIIVCTGLCYAA